RASSRILVALPIDNPDVPLPVDVNAVRKQKHSRAPAGHELAGIVELVDNRPVRPGAGIGAASFGNPNRGAVAVDVDRARRSPRASFGQGEEILDGAIRI